MRTDTNLSEISISCPGRTNIARVTAKRSTARAKVRSPAELDILHLKCPPRYLALRLEQPYQPSQVD